MTLVYLDYLKSLWKKTLDKNKYLYYFFFNYLFNNLQLLTLTGLGLHNISFFNVYSDINNRNFHQIKWII